MIIIIIYSAQRRFYRPTNRANQSPEHKVNAAFVLLLVRTNVLSGSYITRLVRRHVAEQISKDLYTRHSHFYQSLCDCSFSEGSKRQVQV